MESKKTYTVQEATKKLEHFCAYQERCHQEVRKKLEAMSMIPEAIDVIMVHLLDHNFLNEERFAKAFVRGKFNIKHWGRRRLTSELKQRDISKFNINLALAEIDYDDYLTVFSELAENRANLIKERNIYKKRKKFINYFLYRGWESHLVYDKAHEIIF
ncbi:RecX family transcriptional regulator [Tamlana sp. s12]|uniref:regulatory protein RecX n=1 Tax=Tamlana sp. s12 TaxID=1630406 RepID=UPI0007FD2F9A|nr:regulatory protein RecX [Tamlana sp. s12]OBQ57003.1 recombinase RecX [Tamlana sp. s12]QQY82822.1 RecX family transcriptional regulator [Tamlana sp. s12]